MDIDPYVKGALDHLEHRYFESSWVSAIGFEPPEDGTLRTVVLTVDTADVGYSEAVIAELEASRLVIHGVAVGIRVSRTGRFWANLGELRTNISSIGRVLPSVSAGLPIEVEVQRGHFWYGYPNGTVGLICLGPTGSAGVLTCHHIVNPLNARTALVRAYVPDVDPAHFIGETNGPWEVLGKKSNKDASWVPLAPGVAWSASVPGIGKAVGLAPLFSKKTALSKVGATSGLQNGNFESHATKVKVDYHGVRFELLDQVIIRSTGRSARPGDSGSMWMQTDGLASALTVAYQTDYYTSLATPAHTIFRDLGLALIP